MNFKRNFEQNKHIVVAVIVTLVVGLVWLWMYSSEVQTPYHFRDYLLVISIGINVWMGIFLNLKSGWASFKNEKRNKLSDLFTYLHEAQSTYGILILDLRDGKLALGDIEKAEAKIKLALTKLTTCTFYLSEKVEDQFREDLFSLQRECRDMKQYPPNKEKAQKLEERYKAIILRKPSLKDVIQTEIDKN